MKKVLAFFQLLVISLLLLIGTVPHVSAAPSGLYFSPPSGNFAKDSLFSIQLRLGNSSASGVQANIRFDTSKLSVTGTSNQGSSFNPTISYDNSNGSIIVYSATANGSGDRLITTVGFKALNVGTANVTFSGTNQTLTYLLLVPVWSNVTTSDSSYTITASAPTIPPASGGGGTGTSDTVQSPSSTGNTSPSPAASPNTSSTQTISPGITAPNSTDSDANDVPAVTLPDFPTNKQSTVSPKTPQPDAATARNTASSSPIFPWLSVALASILSATAIAIFIVYRRSHMTSSLRTLLSGIISYKVGLTEQPLAPATMAFPLIAPVVALLPKLLAYRAPKLLSSGIKQKLLQAGTPRTDLPRR